MKSHNQTQESRDPLVGLYAMLQMVKQLIDDEMFRQAMESRLDLPGDYHQAAYGYPDPEGKGPTRLID